MVETDCVKAMVSETARAVYLLFSRVGWIKAVAPNCTRSHCVCPCHIQVKKLPVSFQNVLNEIVNIFNIIKSGPHII